MTTPQHYLLHAEGEDLKYESVHFSNLAWGKEEAVRRAKLDKISQTIYQLVPVYLVDVKVNYEFPILEYASDGNLSK